MEVSGVMTSKEFEIQDALGLISYTMKCAMASNECTHIEILELLSKTKNGSYDNNGWVIKYWIAKNVSTPKNVLKRLLKDSRFVVRRRAIENPSTYWVLPRVLMKAMIAIKNIDWLVYASILSGAVIFTYIMWLIF